MTPAVESSISTWPNTLERRSKVRYPLGLKVHFRSVARSLFSGVGRAVDLSSGGALVVFQDVASQDEIKVGVLVQISIEWPFFLDGRVPLQLRAVGPVVRRGASDFAATFERYEFRVVKGRSLRHSSETSKIEASRSLRARIIKTVSPISERREPR
jgi:hypothetical protein